MLSILIADDNAQMRDSLSAWASTQGFHSSSVGSGKGVIATLNCTPIDLLITDVVMPEMEGLETIVWVRSNFPQVKIFAMSGSGSLVNTPVYLNLAKKFGADAVLLKPFDFGELQGLIKYHFKV